MWWLESDARCAEVKGYRRVKMEKKALESSQVQKEKAQHLSVCVSALHFVLRDVGRIDLKIKSKIFR